MGFGSGVQAGVMQDAVNRGNQQKNSLLAAINSPERQAQNAMLQSQLYSPGNLQGGGLNSLLTLQGANNAQRGFEQNYDRNRPPTLLETIFGIAPDVIAAQQRGPVSSTIQNPPSWTKAAKKPPVNNLFTVKSPNNQRNVATVKKGKQ
jgi:hypothetical protein